MRSSLFTVVIALLLALAAVCLGGCGIFKNASSTQPSPVLMFGETLAFNGVKTAANKAYAQGKIDYPAYIAIIDTLTTLKTRAMANGGAVTMADIRAAIDAGAWRAITEYLPEYVKEPETLPPPVPSTGVEVDNTPIAS